MSFDSQTTIENRHDFNTTYTNEFDQDQTAVALITPSAGKAIKVTGIYISTEGATTIGQKVRLYFATTGDTIATFYPSAVANTASTLPISDIVVWGALNEAISLTSNLGTGKNYYIAVNYKEE